MYKRALIMVLFSYMGTFAQITVVLQQGHNGYSGCEDISVADENTPGYKYMESTYTPENSILCAAHFTC